MLQHAERVRGLVIVLAMGRDEGNSLVLENCTRGGEDLNIICFSLEVSYRKEEKISSRQSTCSFPSSPEEEEK